jgi:hypothetical protein
MEFTVAQSLDILERTPSVLDTLLRGTDAAWHTSNEGQNTWSAAEVVGHLIHGEDTDWVPRAFIILENGEQKAFEPFDRFAQLNKYTDWSLDRLLDLFAVRRKANLSVIKDLNLTKDQLAMKGLHPELGPVTLQQLLATWVVHDLNHIAQIARVMAKQYSQEVGVWSAYLSILK